MVLDIVFIVGLCICVKCVHGQVQSKPGSKDVWGSARWTPVSFIIRQPALAGNGGWEGEQDLAACQDQAQIKTPSIRL